MSETTDPLIWPPALSKFFQKLGDYAAGSPIALLSAVTLSLGGLLLLQYSLLIGYLPDADLASMASVFYAVALMGLLLVGSAMACLVMPGLVMAGFRTQGQSIRDHDVATASWLAAVAWGAWLAIMFFDWPLCLTALGALAVGVMGAGLIQNLKGRATQPIPVDLSPPTALALTQDQAQKPSTAKWGRLVWVLICGLFNFALMLMPIFVIFGIGRHGDINYAKNWEAYGVLALLTLLLAIGNALIACARKPYLPVLTLAAASAMLFMVFAMTRSFSAVSAIAVSRLGLGSDQAVAAVVSSQACSQINMVLRQKVCVPAADAQAPSLLCPVALRSRLGSQVVLDFAHMRTENRTRNDKTEASLLWHDPQHPEGQVEFSRVVLDKKELLTWTRVQTVGLKAVVTESATLGLASLPAAAAAAQDPALAVVAQVCGDSAAQPQTEGKKTK